MDRNKRIAGSQSVLVLPHWQLLPDIGLYMDQVVTLMERVFEYMPGAGAVTKSMVNNYVKAGLIRRPSGKKYDRDQLAQLIMISVLKQALSMEEIACVLSELCAQGVEAGYARFCAEAMGEDAAGDEGCAVSAAILAAVQVMRARSLIAAMEKSHE